MHKWFISPLELFIESVGLHSAVRPCWYSHRKCDGSYRREQESGRSRIHSIDKWNTTRGLSFDLSGRSFINMTITNRWANPLIRWLGFAHFSSIKKPLTMLQQSAISKAAPSLQNHRPPNPRWILPRSIRMLFKKKSPRKSVKNPYGIL